MKNGGSISRRQVLTTAIGAGVASVVGSRLLAQTDTPRGTPTSAPTTGPATTQAAWTGEGKRYKVAACDWIMLKRQTNGAITRAKECGCDGVETDMGPLSKNPTFTNKFLSDAGFADKYLADCKANNIEISSIAMSGYYAQSFPERDYEQPLKDCIATCKLLGVKTAFLPLGVMGDVTRRPWHYVAVVERLKRVGEWAEAAGITVGVETNLEAAGECHMLDEIGSKAIKSYFNFENPIRAKLDICKELQTLGKDRVAQIHPTNEDKFWLQKDPAIDMPKIKQCLDAMGWGGWLVIERSRDKDMGREVVKNFTANASYLKSIFQA